MPALPFIPRDSSELEKVRKAFVERATRPSIDELSEEFGIPRGTIGNWSAGEGWMHLRSNFLDRLAESCDARSILLEAAQSVNRPIINQFTSVCLELLQGISRTLQDVDPNRAPSTRSGIYSTCSFAIKNVADACKTIGIVGLPKGLADLGKEGNNQWNPQMLAQINVNVGEIVAKARTELSATLPVQASEPPAKAE